MLAPELWHDPDLRWLTGVHQAQGQSYLIREPYEEMLWWLQLPSLLCLAGEPIVNRIALEEMNRNIDEALVKAEAAGYRIDALPGPSAGPDAAVAREPVVESQASKQEQTQTII